MDEFSDFPDPKIQIDLSHTLHYGSIVKITPSGEEANENYMFCDGFILTNLILQNFSSNQEDSHGSLFRVVPTFFSEVQNHLLNEMNENQNKSNSFPKNLKEILI